MRSTNSRAHDADERAHLAAVKSLPFSCCKAPGPSDAHHIIQGDHFTTIPLCKACHQGPHGIHGDQLAFRMRKLTEMNCLNATNRKLLYGSAMPERSHRSTARPSKILPHREQVA